MNMMSIEQMSSAINDVMSNMKVYLDNLNIVLQTIAKCKTHY